MEAVALVISVAALLVAVPTAFFAWRGVREAVAGQRAQTGPLLEISIGLEPNIPHLIAPPRLDLDFFPVGNRKQDPDDFVIGDIGGLSEESNHLVVSIKNIQKSLSGFASDISIDLKGSWLLSWDRAARNEPIYLRCHCEVLKPGEERKLNALPIGRAIGFAVEVSHLRYRDVWGPSCRAYCGHRGAVWYSLGWEPGFVTWESAVSDIRREARKKMPKGFPGKTDYVLLYRDRLVRLISNLKNM